MFIHHDDGFRSCTGARTVYCILSPITVDSTTTSRGATTTYIRVCSSFINNRLDPLRTACSASRKSPPYSGGSVREHYGRGRYGGRFRRSCSLWRYLAKIDGSR